MVLEKIMKLSKQILLFLALSVLAAFPTSFAIGLLLPEKFVQVRTKNYYVEPKIIWDVLTDLESYPLWKPGIVDISISDELDDNFFPSSWIEFDSTSRKREWKTKELDSPKKFIIETEPSKRFKESLSYTIRQDDDSVHLAVKLTGTFKNPFQRFTQRFVQNHHVYLDSFLINLNQELKRLENNQF